MGLRSARRLFITGTDTDAGKTYVSALIVRALRHSGASVGVYKPVASGCVDPPGATSSRRRHSIDAEILWEASGRRGNPWDVCPQRFLAPVAPPIAARREGTAVDEQLLVEGLIAAESDVDWVLIEGAGGLFSPISANWSVADLAIDLASDVVIVAANRLGTVHQVVATVVAGQARRIPIRGIILNHTRAERDPSADDNAELIRQFTSVPVLATVLYGATTIDLAQLLALSDRG